jgi:DNA-binding NarL/FixJ family response regulator
MLIGRDVERATIDDLIDGFATSSPFVLDVSGDAGSGRSALLAHARAVALEHGATVLAVRGLADTSDLAFAGLLSLLRPFDKQLDELAGDLADPLRAALAMRRERVDPLDVRLAVFRVLTVAAERQPVAVVVDDAEHLDAASIDALRFALGRLGVDRVGAVVASGGRGPFDAVATHRLRLAPLGVDALAPIVEGHVPCVREVAETCALWSGGNPLAALELARSFTDDERNGKVPLPAVPRPTTRVVESVQAELDALSEPARRAVVVVAADRSGSAQVVLAALRALGEDASGLDEAERCGVLVLDGDTVDFRHPLLRPLAYRLVAAASRRTAHRAIAGALTEPQQAAERAWQLVASSAGPDDEVARLLELVAADALRRGAHTEAAATFERAARLSVEASAAHARLRRAATAHLDALAFDEAFRVADEAAAAGDPDAVLLAGEAIERRDGPAAALAWMSAHKVAPAVRADLLVSLGQTAEAGRVLAEDIGLADDLGLAVRAALGGAARERVGDSVTDALGRRARRRWLQVAAERGDAPPSIATIDELLAAARAAEVAGRLDEARVHCDGAAALLPPSPSALGRTVAARRASLEGAAPDALLVALTPAERRVAEAVAGGRTNREVAEHLFLSVKTVDFHLQSVYRKLELRSRTELAVRLARGGRS